jgi:hypothetical protein
LTPSPPGFIRRTANTRAVEEGRNVHVPRSTRTCRKCEPLAKGKPKETIVVDGSFTVGWIDSVPPLEAANEGEPPKALRMAIIDVTAKKDEDA